MANFECSVQLASPVHEVFAFFLNPHNRPLISPPGTGMKVLSGPNPLILGSVLEFKVQGMGMVQEISHQIIELQENMVIVEKLLKGPLRSFQHRHLFEKAGDSSMILRDEIEFEPPGGILGLLATADKILDTFEDGFYYRNAELTKRFGTTA